MSIMELLFADDAVLMSDTVENLKNIVDAFVEVTEAFGQEVSIKKTEVMAINVRVHANPISIFIKGKKLNAVHEFKYVGSTETETAKLDREVDIRIQRSMAGAYSKLAKMFSMYVT